MRFAIIDGGLGHATDVMTHGQFAELRRFHHLSLDHRAFHRQLMSEHHGSRAVRSGRGDKHLQKERFIQPFEKFPGLRIQARVPVRNEQDILDQRRELVP